MPLVFVAGLFIFGFLLVTALKSFDPAAGLGGIFYVPFIVVGALLGGVGLCILLQHFVARRQTASQAYNYNKLAMYGNFAWLSILLTIGICYGGVKVWQFLNHQGYASHSSFYLVLGVCLSLYYVGLVTAFLLAKNSARVR